MGKTIATNKKAHRDYVLLDRWECGIILNGSEVKSVRAGYVNFKNSFARIDQNEALLYNLHIDPYESASYMNPKNPDRPRKLLLHCKEIKKILNEISQKHLALVPTEIYFNDRGFLKVQLALGKGKRSYDKREDIKKREVDRTLDRRMRKSR